MKGSAMFKKIRDLSDFTGDASLYLSDEGRYVIASAVVVPYSGPETLVFAASANGEVTDWAEIGGGRGYLDHETALSTL